MSSASNGADAPQRTYQIPSLLTNSARAILDAFGTDIIQLSAKGSVEVTNRTNLDDLRQYGVTREQRTHQQLSLKYEALPGQDGLANPLTEDVQARIFEEVDAILSQESLSVEPDLAVTSFTIRVVDKRLQDVTPAQTPEFDLRFVADPAEEALRGRTKRLNSDRRLYSELGFQIRNLNLRSVTETAVKHHQQSDGRYFKWRGPTNVRPQSPKRLAIRINNHVLPDTLGTLKHYVVADENVLELNEEETELEDTDHSMEAGQ